MKIVKSQYFKPCPGVDRAFQLAEQAIRLSQEKNIPSYCLGKIVHNKYVVESLEEKGLLTIGKDDYNKKAGLLVTRAHGLPEAIERQFTNANFTVFDATCPLVARNLNLVKTAAMRGKAVIILGTHGHSETKALQGVELFAGVPIFSQIVETEKDIDDIKDIGMPFFVIPQTTFNLEKYRKFKMLIASKYDDVEFHDGLCEFCLKRNTEVVEIAKQADAVLVVGDKQSANTEELFRRVSLYCKNVYKLENYHDIPKNIASFETVALCSGSSTPLKVLDKVIEELTSLL